MATKTPSFDRYLKELSFKLGDPVPDGVGDGQIFSQESRSNYLNRAFGRLMRSLENIMLDITKVISSYYDTFDYVVTGVIGEIEEGSSAPTLAKDFKLVSQVINTNTLLNGLPVFDIFDVYCKIKKDSTEPIEYSRIKYALPEKYFKAQFGDDEYYKKNDDTRTFFYAVINSEIKFLAGEIQVSNIYFFLKNSTFVYKHDADKDLIIPNEYEDVFLSIASEEAMIDEGSPKSLKKAQLFNQLVAQQLQIVSRKEDIRREAEEPTKTTDAA